MVFGSGHCDINHRFAICIGDISPKGFQCIAEGNVIAPKDIAWPFCQTGRRVKHHFAFNRKIGTWRTEQIFCIDGQLRDIGNPYRSVAKAKGKINPFRQEIFDKKCGRGQRARVQIGINLHRPNTARG